MGIFRRLTLFAALALFACDGEDEVTYVEEEVTIAEYSFAPDDDQTDADGVLHRKGTATIFPDGRTDPAFPKDGIEFEAAISSVNLDRESTVTMKDTFHNVTRIFFVTGGGTRFGMRDISGAEVVFNNEADGSATAAGQPVQDVKEALDVAFRTPLYQDTPHEIFALTYAIVKDGFVDSKSRGGNPACVSGDGSSRLTPEQLAAQQRFMGK